MTIERFNKRKLKLILHLQGVTYIKWIRNMSKPMPNFINRQFYNRINNNKIISNWVNKISVIN